MNSILNKDDAKAKLLSTDFLIPTAIFIGNKLSFLETLVEYIKESYGLTYHQIAELTGRDERNIWTIYSRASRKRRGMPYEPPIHDQNIFFPLSILRQGQDISASPLEAVAFYLKSKGLQNREIGRLLGRSSKTIWTVLSRAAAKSGQQDAGGGLNE